MLVKPSGYVSKPLAAVRSIEPAVWRLEKFMPPFLGSWPAYLASAAVMLTGLFTFLDPGPSKGLDLGARAAFWFAHIGGGLAILGGCQLLLGRLTAIGKAPALAQVVLAGLVGSIVFAPYALFLDQLFPAAEASTETLPIVDHGAEEGWQLALGLARALGSEMAAFILPLTVTWLLINIPMLMEVQGLRFGKPGAAPDTVAHARETPLDPIPTRQPGFWEAVPPHIGRDLICLSAELHYLRVHTTQGEALILQSFGRAIEELSETRGMQIHRSHWVALAHVTDLARDGERMLCTLTNGLVLPVSRPYRAALRAAVRD